MRLKTQRAPPEIRIDEPLGEGKRGGPPQERARRPRAAAYCALILAALTICAAYRLDAECPLGCPLSRLLYLFGLAGLPRLVEPRVKRAVQPEDREPTLAGDRLHPVGLLARGRLGAEIKVDRAVGVGDQLVTLVILGESIPIALGVASAQPAPLAPNASARMGQLDCNIRSIQTHSTGLAMRNAEKSTGTCVLPLQSRSHPAMTGATVMPA
jgi:hypothetical protein